MPRLSNHPKVESFNLRVDAELKAEFQAATEAVDQPAAQVVREFMRRYVQRRRQSDFASEAQRQSRIIAGAAGDPASEEMAAMAWVEEASDLEGWIA